MFLLFILCGRCCGRHVTDRYHACAKVLQMRKNSLKNVQINSLVQRELAHIISQEVKYPRIAPMVSVMEVEVAPDLKTCKAYISVLGDDEAMKNTIAGLKRAEGFIRSRLAATVNLRNTPQITFLPDRSIEYGVEMIRKIEEVNAADAEAERTERDEED